MILRVKRVVSEHIKKDKAKRYFLCKMKYERITNCFFWS